MTDSTIIYTYTDEAPALATASLLPIVQAFAAKAGVEVETRDISLAGRILAAFDLGPDALAELGALAKRPEANIVKLPNVSASSPQLKAAIKELQDEGHAVPDYPDNPTTDEEKAARAAYDKVKGSAVNPVLREGNSDRRAPASVKNYARKHPHSMGAWTADSKTNVATMDEHDFAHNEKSVVLDQDDTLRIEHVAADGTTTVLKESLPVLAGEVVDATTMEVGALREFLAAQVARAKDEGVLFSVHLKATMMKVSDPIIFGHAVRAFFPSIFETYAAELASVGASPNDGLGAVLKAIESLPADKRAEIEAAVKAGLRRGAGHRDGQLRQGHHQPARAERRHRRRVDAGDDPHVGPHVERRRRASRTPSRSCPTAPTPASTRSSSTTAARTAPSTRRRWARCPTSASWPRRPRSTAATTRPSRSRPTAWCASSTARGATSCSSTQVSAGDIWRACQTKDVPIRDWVKLAVTRARATGVPAIFWLDEDRAHDANLIAKVKEYLGEHDTDGLDIEILKPTEAIAFSLERIRKGEDTISVTGNVLRDYLTDLFPILELGTSAKMLSVVPAHQRRWPLRDRRRRLGARSTSSSSSQENYLRWDSLGEFLALAVSLEHFGEATDNPRAKILGDALDRATGKLLDENKSPARKVGQIDNRGSHFWLALYWAQELAAQTTDAELADAFTDVAAAAGREGRGHRRRAHRRPGPAGGHRRLLPDATPTRWPR